VRDVPGGSVAIDHRHREGTGVRELVENAGRDIDRLASLDSPPFLPQAHLTGPLDDKIDLLLLLVVPWDLSAGGLERDKPEREICRLYRRSPPDEVLCPAPGWVGATGDLIEIGCDHRVLPFYRRVLLFIQVFP
jgi:hypothetical protein